MSEYLVSWEFGMGFPQGPVDEGGTKIATPLWYIKCIDKTKGW